MTKNSAGFTLIELMIVVVVVAVLAAVALPSYSQYIRKAHRAQAQGFMLAIANKEEQFILDQRAYTAVTAGFSSGSNVLALQQPSETVDNYDFVVVITGNDCSGTALVTPSYVITATAKNAQLVDGNLCLDKIGNRTPLDKWK